MKNIRIAKSDSEILVTYPVMKQLRPNIRRSAYLRLVKMQQAEYGFQIAMLTEEGRVTCVAGFRVCHSLGWGRYLYVDDLITAKNRRSKGDGKAMFNWLIKRAQRLRCSELRLDSAVTRHEAHRFYLRERMDIVCFHFRLIL